MVEDLYEQAAFDWLREEVDVTDAHSPMVESLAAKMREVAEAELIGKVDEYNTMIKPRIEVLEAVLAKADALSKALSTMLGRLPLSAQLLWKEFADVRAKVKP